MATGVSDEQGGGPLEGGRQVDCDEAVRQLYRFLDGELTEERRHRISVHLDECGWCGEAAGFEAELRVVIASRCRDRVPESLKSRIAATIQAEARRQAMAADGAATGVLGSPAGLPPDRDVTGR